MATTNLPPDGPGASSGEFSCTNRKRRMNFPQAEKKSDASLDSRDATMSLPSALPTSKPSVTPTSAGRIKRKARRSGSNACIGSIGSNSCIGAETPTKTLAKTSFRFAIGDQVSCRINNGWARGIVIKHNYRESRWPSGETAPYQVCLDGRMTLDGHDMEYRSELDGNLIYAPRDLDVCIRPVTQDEKVAKSTSKQTYNKRETGGKKNCCKTSPNPFHTAEPRNQCDYCKRFVRKVYECGGCRKVAYCGRKCQKYHWKYGHREECKKYRNDLTQQIVNV